MDDPKAAQEALERFEANLVEQQEKVENEPDSYLAWDSLGDAYMDLDRIDEAFDAFFKVLELDPQNVQTLGKISMLYQGRGDLENARKYADLNYSYHPEHYKPNYVLVGILIEEENFKEAEGYNKVCLSLYPQHPETNFRMATIYTGLGDDEKARECWENGTKMVYDSALSYCSRGQCYFKLGKKEEALEDFKKAKSMIYDATSFTPSQKEYTRKALMAVLEAEELSNQAEAHLGKLTQGDNPDLKKRVLELYEKQKEAQDKVVNGIGKSNKEADDNMRELEELREELSRQLAEMNNAEAAARAQERYLENLARQKENVENEPESYLAWDNLGDAYMELDKIDEAFECFFKVIELDPENVQTLGKISMLYQGIGDLENARKYADLNYSYHPEHYKPNYVLVGILMEEENYEEAEGYNQVCLNLYPLHPETNVRMATIYAGLGDDDKAMECYENGTKMVYNSALSYASRGRCYFKLGKRKEALEDFKKAISMIYDATSFTPSQKECTRKCLKALLESEAISTKATIELERLKQQNSNPALKKFVKNLKNLQDRQKEAEEKVMSGFNKSAAEANQSVSELERLKHEFNKQLNRMRDVVKVVVRVQTLRKKFSNKEDVMVIMKQGISKKVEEFEQKLRTKLDKQKMSIKDKSRIQEYFKAFVDTFTSGYVTTHIIASGQTGIDNTSDNSAMVLSTLASFLPFAGSVLEYGFSTVEECLQNNELMATARKFKRLGNNTGRVGELVGITAYHITINKDQQNRILKTTDEDVEEVAEDLVKKIVEFCEDLDEAVDSSLYSDMYGTPAERLGYNDANMLIEKYINAEFSPYMVEKEFVKEIMRQTVMVTENDDEDNTAATTPEQIKIGGILESAKTREGNTEQEIIQRRCRCNMF